jgi:polyisoprenoid-binding protein YceI
MIFTECVPDVFLCSVSEVAACGECPAAPLDIFHSGTSLGPGDGIIIRVGDAIFRLAQSSDGRASYSPVPTGRPVTVRYLLKSAAVAFAAALALTAGAAEAQAISASPAAVQAGSYKLDPAHSKITWSVTHFGFSTYVGQFASVNGTLKLNPKAPANDAVNVTVDTGSIGTLNPALDTHLKSKEFLDVATFPTAAFKATKVTVTGERTANIDGQLTLHGVTRPVVVHAVFNQGGANPLDKKYSLGFAGSAKIKRSEFGITAYVPAISDDVTLTIEAEFKAVPAA